jgi:putative PIN family toxin of toxin-antitoxin system
MTPNVVYDTNVIVSAALKEGSVPASLVALARGLFLSPAIWEEYRAVLPRPKLGLSPDAVAAFLRDLRRAATMVRPTQQVTVAPHEPDNRFLECAYAAKAEYLVTGNKRHFPFATFHGTMIVSPAEFAAYYYTLTEQD